MGLIGKAQNNQTNKSGAEAGTIYDLLDWLKKKVTPDEPVKPPPYDVKADKRWLNEWVRGNEGNINKWLKDRPSVERSYDDLRYALDSGNIRLKPVPQDEWESFRKKNRSDNAAAWYQGYGGNTMGGVIYYPEGKFQVKHNKHDGYGPHEVMHFFASHTPGHNVGIGSGNVPEINPYQKLDMRMGGWLPSFHPGGRRPWSPRTDEDYHPWFDEGAFNRPAGWGNPSHPDSRESVFNAWKEEKIEELKGTPKRLKDRSGRLIKSAAKNLDEWRQRHFP